MATHQAAVNNTTVALLVIANVATTNLTTDPWTPEWTIAPIFSLISFIVGLVGNGTLLALFAVTPSLRSPFNVYIISLLLANLACILIQYPLDFIHNLYTSVWVLLGNRWCTLYLYADICIQACVFNSHQLIAVNRLWATLYPIHYRSHHTVRVAACMCLGMWLYVHAYMLPGITADALYYRLPLDTYACLLNTLVQPKWATAMQLVFFNLPECVMVLTFPVIGLAKLLQSRRMRQAREVAPHGPLPVNVATGPSDPSSVTVRVRPVRKSQGLQVLALLTVSVVICWTPNCVYYTVITFVWWDVPKFAKAQAMLFLCQTMLDPLLFTLALPQLRETLRRVFLRR